MTKVLQGLAYPARMKSHFHVDSVAIESVELLSESILGGGNATFLDHFSVFIEINNVGKFTSKVNSGKKCAIVKHGRFLPFCTYECANLWEHLA
jgi:hypothetical protein